MVILSIVNHVGGDQFRDIVDEVVDDGEPNFFFGSEGRCAGDGDLLSVYAYSGA